MSIEKPSRNLNLLAPFFQDLLLDALAECKAAGLNIEVFEAYRSPQRQDWLYTQGRTRSGKKVTYAKGWESWHNVSLAADLVFYKDKRWSWDGDYKAVHKIFEAKGFETLDFEAPHVQITGGYLIHEAVKIAKDQGVLALWQLVEQRFKISVGSAPA